MSRVNIPRTWGVGIIILFACFTGLLIPFLLANVHLHELVQPAAAGSATQPRVVLIGQELDNPYWRKVEQGAAEAANQQHITLEYTGPLRINPEEQVSLLAKAVASRPAAIMVQGIHQPEQKAWIDKAAALGIPVITLDADEPGSRRLAYIGTDNYEAGRKMGQYIAKYSSGRGSIGVMVSNFQSYSQQLRLKGFRSVIAEYPHMRILEVTSSENSRLQAAQRSEELLKKDPHPESLVGFSSLDGLGILEAAERTGSSAGIFAFDDLDETLQAVRENRIELTLIQQPYRMGYDGVTMIRDYLSGKASPGKKYTEISVMASPSFMKAEGKTP